MYDEFDFSILSDPEFKEDSVREELIQPLIKLLGYKVSGRAKVIRSRKLKHPFLSIGSTRNKISIIPDYVFEIEGNIHWVLDVKSPSEKISKSKHVEQAYSYAIHPETRSRYYALCNGHEFALYDIRKFEPVLSFKMVNINKYLDKLIRILDPKIMANSEVVDYQQDFGLALKKVGVKPDFIFIALQVHTNFFAKIEDGLYTTSTTITDGGIDFLASFDFNDECYNQLLEILNNSDRKIVKNGLSHQPFSIHREQGEFLFGLKASLQSTVHSNAEESYISFKVSEFFPYAYSPNN